MDETAMIAATSAPRLRCELPADPLDALAVSVGLGPQQSVVSLLRQAASGRALGAPGSIAAAPPGRAPPAGRQPPPPAEGGSRSGPAPPLAQLHGRRLAGHLGGGRAA